MITFTKLGEWGRLGNQLYQYAALKGIANKYNLKAKVPSFENKEWHNQKCLLTEFQIDCEKLTENDVIKEIIYEPQPSGFYYENYLNIKNDVDIFGYFQNTYYFSNIQEQIKKELIPKESYLTVAKEYLNLIKNNRTLISIHIRRGDMVDGTNPKVPLYNENPFDNSSEFGNYLNKSIDFFSKKEDPLFLVFVGGSRTGDDKTDINWAKKYFNSDKFVISESNNPIVDFSRMILCDHNIISHSSTFGWWAGYVNPNPNKIVIAPSNYHLNNTTHQRDGFFPKEWIVL